MVYRLVSHHYFTRQRLSLAHSITSLFVPPPPFFRHIAPSQSLLPRDALQRIKHTLRVVVSRVGDHAHNDEEEQQQEEQEDDVRVIAEKETEGAETFSLLAMDKSGKRKIGLGIGLQREICDHFESRDNLIDTLLSSK